MLHRIFAFAICFATLAATTPFCDAQKKKKKKKPQIQEEQKPWWDSPQPRFSTSELGRTFSGTIEMRDKAPVKDRNTYKAIAVRLGEDGKAATAIFDTEMLRMAADTNSSKYLQQPWQFRTGFVADKFGVVYAWA